MPQNGSPRPESSPRNGADRKQPRITIITPSYNQGDYIERTIRSVLDQQYPNLEFLVMDGGSDDGTVDILRRYDDRIDRWVSEPDKGQSHAINKGLALATGDVFNWLNSDDWLESGALRQVAKAWTAAPDAAAWVGGCRRVDQENRELNVICPNGMTLDNMGENWNGKQFYQPSCFMNTALVRRLGGVDASLNFCMDLHLWLRLAKHGPFVAGQGVWSNALIHSGAKTQALRRQMHLETVRAIAEMGFERGAAARRRHALRNAPHDYVLPGDLQTALRQTGDPNAALPPDLRGLRLAVVSNLLPRHDAASSNLRVFSLLRLMLQAGAEIQYFHFHATPQDEAYRRDLGVQTQMLPEDPKRAAEAVAALSPDAVWLTNLWTPNFLRLQTDILRRLGGALPTVPVLLDTMDLHSRKYRRKYEHSRDVADLALAREFLDLEAQAYPLAHAVLAVGDAERRAILDAVPDSAPVAVVPNMHPMASAIAPMHQRQGLVFLGNFHVNHNEDAARHFVAHILPLIHARRPDIRFTCIGQGADTVLADLASDTVRPVGFVSNLERELGRHRVFVCPLTYGTGLKGKVGTAAACGIPMVATSVGAEGFGFTDGAQCFIADDPTDFALKTLHLHEDPVAWQNFVLRAWITAAGLVSPKAVSAALADLFAALPGGDAAKDTDTTNADVAANVANTVDAGDATNVAAADNAAVASHDPTETPEA